MAGLRATHITIGTFLIWLIELERILKVWSSVRTVLNAKYGSIYHSPGNPYVHDIASAFSVDKTIIIKAVLHTTFLMARLPLLRNESWHFKEIAI